MRRRLFVAAIVLLSAALVNVAAAWACAMLTTLGLSEQEAIEANSDRLGVWQVRTRSRPGAVFVHSTPRMIWDGPLPKSQHRPADLLPFWFPLMRESEQVVD